VEGLRDRVGAAVGPLRGEQGGAGVPLDGDGELVTARVVGELGDELVDGGGTVELVHVEGDQPAADGRDRSLEPIGTFGVIGELDSHA
jgi:hypothetical protein